MNDDKKFKDSSDEHIPSSPNGVGNKGVTSTGGGGNSDSDSHLHHHQHQFSFMGPNHNNNLHQYHSGNSQHHGHRQDNLNKIGGGLGITINSNNGHSNDGIMGSHSNNSNHLNNNSSNGISNGNSSSSSSNFSSEVCRDFLRNVCRRGANCRYRHPEGSEAEELGKKVDLIFCHDFQNKECRRSNCRFIHCTKQEEDVYRVTGKLPTHLIEKLSYSRLTASSSPSPTSSSSGSFHHHHHPLHQSQHQQSTDFMKSVTCDNSTTHRLTSNSLIASTLASSFVSSLASTLSSSVASSSTVASPFSNPIPVCKDNLKGDCLRGLRCKFRHISQAEYDLELRSVAVYSAGGGLRPSPMDRNHFHHHAPSSGSPMDGPTSYQGGLAPPEPKRRAYDASLASQPPFNHALPPPHSQRTISSLNHQGLSSIQSSTPNDFEFSKPPPPPNQTFFNTSTNNNNRYHLEDENLTLRRHIDELKKQVSDLMASNEFLMEQNAQLRTLGTRSTTPLPPSTLHSNSTTSTPQLSLSDDSFIGTRIVDHHQQHLPVALTTSLNSQSMGGIPVSSMATLSNNVLNNSTNPLVSYPIMTANIQSLRPPTIPHSLSH